MMGDMKFILGFVAGWIATTEEGKKAANAFAAKTVEIAKKGIETASKPQD